MDHNVLERILEKSMMPTNLPLPLLENITDKFSKNLIIGEGGFGTVYKGVLPNGNVAVKRIRSNHTIDENLFRREVNSLMEVYHPNVVRFLGYCSNTEHTRMPITGFDEYIYVEIRARLLCFEYINNGSLDKHITDELRGLDWDTRYKIIKGICEGLKYLHMEKHIIHMDLKPGNILLDNQMVPKITDFGLSRLTQKSQTTTANPFLTLGYCAPEQLNGGRITVKTDIYSLGIIIIELVTGRKGIPSTNNVLRRWRHRWNKSAKDQTPLAHRQVTQCIEIGLRCQQIDPLKRPFISKIIDDIDKMESTNMHIENADESAVCQINPYSKDDMLGVEPLDLHFAYVHNNQLISSSLELTNPTDGYMAFNIQTTSPLLYSIQPNNGIVPPQIKCSVEITLPAQEMKLQDKQYTEFIVRSLKVNDDLEAKDINEDMFNIDTGNVDEVNLVVASGAKPQAPCLSEEPREDLSLAVSGTADVSNVPAQSSTSHIGPGGAICEVIPDSCELINVYPLELRVPFKHNKRIPCSLHLTNSTDERVVFRLDHKKRGYFFRELPVHGIVPPRSTYTLVVTTYEMKELPTETDIDLILQNSVADEFTDKISGTSECDEFFKEAKEMGDTFNEVALKAVCAPNGEMVSEPTILPVMKIISVEEMTDNILCLDANAKEPWIIIGSYKGKVGIWNYDTQRLMHSFRLSKQTVTCTKFVERKQWFLAGISDGSIHVYDYIGTKPQKVKTFRASNYSIESLAIHPTQPYVLSSASSTEIKLWDWDKDWECIRIFHHEQFYDDVTRVVFNPRDSDSFATASKKGTVKVWNLDSPKSAIYTLSGHSGEVSCLDFFTRDDQQYLITGSKDQTAKIWDMEKKTCVHTIEGFTSQVISVISKRPYLITGSEDGLVYLWSSSDFTRLERVLHNNCGSSSQLRSLACLMGSNRVVIGQRFTLSIMDIDAATPERPPGFCTPLPRAPTPRQEPSEPLLRAPVLLRREPSTPLHIPFSTPPTSPTPAPADYEAEDAPLFLPRQAPLLPEPSLPRLPLNRRKTLVGGFPVRRSSSRLRAKNGTAPVAKLAERLLCRRLGIIQDGEQLTEEAIAKFVALFKGTLPPSAVSALRVLFRLDCDLASAVRKL